MSEEEEETKVESGASGHFSNDERAESVGEEELEGPFTDDEIRTQLEALGYTNIPDYQLRLFKEDLEKLIWFEQDKKRKPKHASASKPDEEGRKRSTKMSTKEPFSSYKTGARKNLVTQSAKEGKHRQQEIEEYGWPKGRTPSPHSTDSTRSRSPRWHRRKVVRHFRGEPIICEEPTDTDTDITLLSDRVSSLPMDDSESEPATTRRRELTWSRDCPIVGAVVCKKPPSQRSSISSTTARKRAQASLYYDEFIRYLPKSFMDGQPYRAPKKTNPHQRYDMYRRMWNNCRIPGEASDQELRWCIRALLLTRKVPEVEIYALKRKDAIERARNRKQ